MAAKRHPSDYPQLMVINDQPLIGVPVSDLDTDAIVYFTDEDAADQFVSDDAAVQEALALAGAWSDVSWDEIEAGLDRIRHANRPSPPLEP